MDMRYINLNVQKVWILELLTLVAYKSTIFLDNLIFYIKLILCDPYCKSQKNFKCGETFKDILTRKTYLLATWHCTADTNFYKETFLLQHYFYAIFNVLYGMLSY
jgi:hypothetical protein